MSLAASALASSALAQSVVLLLPALPIFPKRTVYDAPSSTICQNFDDVPSWYSRYVRAPADFAGEALGAFDFLALPSKGRRLAKKSSNVA